jgi:tetratricopeptide (TPR) repeat protein
LDFGLARITDADVAATALSEIGMIKGTLQYMSPEQARGDVDAIDTRTDVYALGVVLYEMLTMRRPIDVESASIAEAVRVICEERPTPLHRNWAGSRKLDADLETIVGKALEKEADRRYASVAAMADDIERYLASQPIEARPPSALYQLRKFAARNRTLVGSAAAAMLLLVAFAVTMTVQAERIQREAERANREASTAREVTEFLITLFDRSDPTLAQGEELTARQILDTGAERIEELGDQPPTQAALMETIGRVFTILGEYDRAEPLLESAVAIRTERAESDELALAESLYHQAALLDNQGRYEEAEEPIRRAVEIQERTLGENPVLCQSLNVLGNVLWHQGRLDEAEVVHRQALEIRDRILPPDHTDIGQSLHNLGALRYFDNDLAEAENMWRRSAEIEKAAHGPNDWNYATSLHTLSIAVRDQGRLDEALDLALQSLAIREKALGADHPHVALSLTNLGAIYRQMDRADEAEPMVRRAITVAENSMGPDHPEVFWMRTTLARILVTLERFDDAERELKNQIADIERAGLESELPPCLGTLADLQARLGRFEESEQTYLEAIEIVRSSDPDDPTVGLLSAGLARVYRDTGRRAEALESLRRALPLMEAGWGADDPDYLEAAAELAALEDRQAPS